MMHVVYFFNINYYINLHLVHRCIRSLKTTARPIFFLFTFLLIELLLLLCIGVLVVAPNIFWPSTAYVIEYNKVFIEKKNQFYLYITN